jgi:hypothetical protein
MWLKWVVVAYFIIATGVAATNDEELSKTSRFIIVLIHLALILGVIFQWRS